MGRFNDEAGESPALSRNCELVFSLDLSDFLDFRSVRIKKKDQQARPIAMVGFTTPSRKGGGSIPERKVPQTLNPCPDPDRGFGLIYAVHLPDFTKWSLLL